MESAGNGGEAWLGASPAGLLELQQPGSGQGVIFERVCGPAAPWQAAAGCECPGAGAVVDLAGCTEVAEALACCGFRDAELAGQLSQRQRAAASPAFPPSQQLQRVDDRRRAAPALSRRMHAGELRGLGAELAVEAPRDVESVPPADGSAWIRGVEVVRRGDQGDALEFEEVTQVA